MVDDGDSPASPQHLLQIIGERDTLIAELKSQNSFLQNQIVELTNKVDKLNNNLLDHISSTGARNVKRKSKALEKSLNNAKLYRPIGSVIMTKKTTLKPKAKSYKTVQLPEDL